MEGIESASDAHHKHLQELKLGHIDPHDKAQFERDFVRLVGHHGHLGGKQGKEHFEQTFPSLVPTGAAANPFALNRLKKIWELADVDKDGA